MAKDNSAVTSPEQSVCLSRNASMRGTGNGVPINNAVRKDTSMEICDVVPQEKDFDTIPSSTSHERKFSFSSCSSDGLASSKESFKQHSTHNRDKCNGVLLHVSGETSPEAVSKAPKSAVPNVEDHDDRARPPLIQQRGRFKVTPGHVEFDKSHPPGLQKCHSMQTISHLPPLSIPSSAEAASNIIGGSIYVQLYNVLQTNMQQREQILNAMKLFSCSDMVSPSIPSMASPYVPSASRSISPSSALSIDRSMLEAANEREKELVNEILELQWRLLCAQDEVQRLKAKAAQV